MERAGFRPGAPEHGNAEVGLGGDRVSFHRPEGGKHTLSAAHCRHRPLAPSFCAAGCSVQPLCRPSSATLRSTPLLKACGC